MRRRLIIFATLSCVVGAGFWSVIYTHRAAKADSISTLLSGSAYGLAIGAASGAAGLVSGPFGEVSTVCTPYPTNHRQTLQGISLFHGLITSTTIQDGLTFIHGGEKSTVEASSQIERLTIGNPLLKPLVEVDGLHAIARSNASIGSAFSDTSASFFGVIKIAGLSLPLHIAPNTQLELPGLGKIVLNEQIRFNTNPVTTYAEVNMVDITLEPGNLLHQPLGTHIIIGHSISSDTIVSVLAAMQAHAYGLATKLGVGSLAHMSFGPVPNTEIGCLGGTHSTTAAQLALGNLVDAGVADTHATGILDEARSTAEVFATEKIANLSLLDGLIKVGLIQERAHAIYSNKSVKSDGDFETLNLTVGGARLLSLMHKPNIRLNLADLGYVIVNEIEPGSNGYTINALDIHVTMQNKWHLAVGLRIIVGHVDASILLFN